MIAIRNVTKEFDVNKQKVTALSDVNFTIEKGDIFGIIGFSGAGKDVYKRQRSYWSHNSSTVMNLASSLVSSHVSGLWQ